MSLGEKIRLMLALDALIKRRMKGSSRDYAEKLGISRSTFFRLLEYVKDEFEIPIFYNKVAGCYEYEKDGFMYFGFIPLELIPKESLKKIRGGQVFGSEDFPKIFS